MGFTLLNFSRIVKFQVFHHQRNSSLDKLPSVTWSLQDPFSVELLAPFEDIETGFVQVKWLRQLMTRGQLTLWDLKLKILVAWKSPDVPDIALIFFLKEPKSFSLYLLLREETIFVSQDEGLISSGWSQKLNVVIEKSMSLAMIISCNMLPRSNIFSR